MIGFVMLAGIIVNNGIVLIDYVNQLRAQGVSKFEALVEAGITRSAADFDDYSDYCTGPVYHGNGDGNRCTDDAAGSHCLHWLDFYTPR